MSDQNITADLSAAASNFMARGLNRRSLLAKAGLVGAAAVGAGLMGGTTSPAEAALSTSFGPKGKKFGINDVDILNFALNLEYLEAEFYVRATTGNGLSALPDNPTTPGAAKGTGTVGTVTGGSAVQFASPSVQQYANEIAADELAHVRFLRTALGKNAIAEPSIDLDTAFTNAAIAAGIITTGQTFTPFGANSALGLTPDVSFLLGAFIFEDVGVSAYHGAAPYIKNSTYLSAAAGILAVEAYHASEVRLQLYQTGTATGGSAIIAAATAISNLRSAATRLADNNPTEVTDQSVTIDGTAPGAANIVPTDSNGLAFARSFAAVLNIVYLNASATPAASGGFFPNGLNGRITSLVPPAKK